MPIKKKTMASLPSYRLTLTQHAFALALSKNSAAAGQVAVKRPDGKWNVGITMATLDQLKTAAKPGENLSDTVMRILS